MTPSKKHVVAFVMALMSFSLPLFLVTGYTALYWAWVRGDLQAALPYLPWARNFGMLAMASAAAALAILFSSRTFPIPPRTRLWLSLLATATIAFFSEFRNEGKFHFKNLVHFFGPGTWIHDGLNQIVSSLGDFLYRVEYSHWNDFLMGPAIVSVLFSLAFLKIYGAVGNPGPVSLKASAPDVSPDLGHALRFARTLMNVGLFWFFIHAWAEKAGYLSNPHSNDEIDLPVEFGGVMVGFWMVRALTRPFGKMPEQYRSTFLIDFLSSGVMGLLYTLIVSALTESVAGAVAHSLYPVVPGALEVSEYTPLQQHMRPFELLLLAGVMWWSLSRSSRREQMTRLSGTHGESESGSRWDVPAALGAALVAATACLLVVATLLSLLEPQGLGWTLATAGMGMGIGAAALLLVRRTWQRGFTTVLGRNDDKASG